MKLYYSKCVFMKTAIVFLLLLIGVQLTSCNYFESEKVKLEKAQTLYKENKFNQAIVRLKSILQSDPGSCEARILLGKSQFAKFNLLDAQDSLEKAGKQKCKDPQLFYLLVKMQLYRNRLSQAKQLFSEPGFDYASKTPEAQRLKGDMYFLANDYAKAKAAYAGYNDKSHNPAMACLTNIKLSALENDYSSVIDQSEVCGKKYAEQKGFDIDQVRYLRAIAQVRLKDTSAAIKTLQSLLANYVDLKDPNIKIQSSLLLMNLYLARKDVENAAKMADALLRYVAIPGVYYAKGLKYEKDNRFDLAEKQFLEALKLDPRHQPSLLELANLKFKEGNIEQAKYYTGKVDALTGKNQYTERLDELLAIKYFQAGDLDAIINKLPHDSSLKSQYILALAYARKGEHDKALQVFDKIKQKLKDSAKIDLLEARLDIALRNLDQAEAIFAKYAQQGNAYAIGGLTQLYIAEHKYAEAETLLTGLLKKDPKNANARLLMAELYSTTNQKQKLFDLLDSAIAKEPGNLTYKLALAKMYYKYKRYSDAITQCEKIIQARPDAAQSYIVKANAYIRLGEIDAAENTYHELLKQKPNSDYAYLMLSYLAEKQSKYDHALNYVDKALEINPRNLKAVYAKIDYLAAQKKKADVIDFAKSSANVLTQKQAKNLLLGFAYDKLGDSKNAYLNYKIALANGDQDVRLALIVYRLSKQVNGEMSANKELADFLRTNPALQNLYLVANHFMNVKNYVQATKYYELFIKTNQKNPVVYNNLAWLKLHAGETSAALIYANQALGLAPQSPAIMDTMGQVLLKKGDYDKAGSYLLSAYKKLGDNPNVKYHLAQFYYYKNNLDKSKSLLQQIVNTSFSEQKDAQKLLATISH